MLSFPPSFQNGSQLPPLHNLPLSHAICHGNSLLVFEGTSQLFSIKGPAVDLCSMHNVRMLSCRCQDCAQILWLLYCKVMSRPLIGNQVFVLINRVGM